MIEFKSAFLQTGKAKRDVYVKPLPECKTRTKFYWMLLAAAFGLVNCNAKCEEFIDQSLNNLEFSQLVSVT